MSFSVDVRGLTRLARSAGRVQTDLTRGIGRTQIRRAVEASGIKDAARSEAPVGATGNLRRSVRVVADARKVELRAGSKRAFYGWWVHEGTEHAAANPFLERARTAARVRRIQQLLERDMGIYLRKVGM